MIFFPRVFVRTSLSRGSKVNPGRAQLAGGAGARGLHRCGFGVISVQMEPGQAPERLLFLSLLDALPVPPSGHGGTARSTGWPKAPADDTGGNRATVYLPRGPVHSEAAALNWRTGHC